MEEIDKKCSCEFCKKHKKYKRYINNIEDEETKEFFKNILDELMHTKDDLEYKEIKLRAFNAKFGHFSLTKSIEIIKEYEDE